MKKVHCLIQLNNYSLTVPPGHLWIFVPKQISAHVDMAYIYFTLTKSLGFTSCAW